MAEDDAQQNTITEISKQNANTIIKKGEFNEVYWQYLIAIKLTRTSVYFWNELN